MEYRVVQNGHLPSLENGVRGLIAEGWEPAGGISCVQQLSDATKNYGENRSTLYDAGFMFAQAMIRRVSPASADTDAEARDPA